jgi:hypothetical protein
MKLKNFPPISKLVNFASLDLSENPITSFQGLPTLPNLVDLDLSRTQIKSFEFVQPQPALTRVHLTGTLVGHYVASDVMASVGFGPALQIVNGNPIRPQSKALAESIRVKFLPFLQEGWVIVGLNPLAGMHVRTQERRLFTWMRAPAPSKICAKAPVQKKRLQPVTVKAWNSSRSSQHPSAAKAQREKTPSVVEAERLKEEEDRITLEHQQIEAQRIALLPEVQEIVEVVEYKDLSYEEALRLLRPEFTPQLSGDSSGVLSGASSCADFITLESLERDSAINSPYERPIPRTSSVPGWDGFGRSSGMDQDRRQTPIKATPGRKKRKSLAEPRGSKNP